MRTHFPHQKIAMRYSDKVPFFIIFTTSQKFDKMLMSFFFYDGYKSDTLCTYMFKMVRMCNIFMWFKQLYRILEQILRETITYLFNIHIHVYNNILNTWNPKISSAWEIGESYLENINKAVIPVQILYLSTGDTVAHFKTCVIHVNKAASLDLQLLSHV